MQKAEYENFVFYPGVLKIVLKESPCYIIILKVIASYSKSKSYSEV